MWVMVLVILAKAVALLFVGLTLTAVWVSFFKIQQLDRAVMRHSVMLADSDEYKKDVLTLGGRVYRLEHMWAEGTEEPLDTDPIDPIEYYDGGEQEPPEGYNAPGWYFFDRTWELIHGPHGTEEAARESWKNYCRAYF